MHNIINKRNAVILGAFLFVVSCTSPQKSDSESQIVVEVPQEITYNTDDAKSIIKAVEMANGSWNKLWEQKDVEFTYSYSYPDGKADLSTERYVFDTEQSWAKYTQHDINAMPGTEGEVVQYYDGNVASMMHDTVKIDNPEAVGGAQFLRKANYFWFVMMYKLDNPGANFQYMGTESLDGINYDKVKVDYDPAVTGKEQNDIYVLYVNPETKLVDQFYFSLAVMGMSEPAILMKLQYEEINGLKVPTTRNIFMPSENGYSEEPNLVQKSTGVKFNNGFTEEIFNM